MEHKKSLSLSTYDPLTPVYTGGCALFLLLLICGVCCGVLVRPDIVNTQCEASKYQVQQDKKSAKFKAKMGAAHFSGTAVRHFQIKVIVV